MRSTNPIWRLAPVFGQLSSWNEKRTRRKRRSREEVRRLVDEFEASGLERAQFSHNTKGQLASHQSTIALPATKTRNI
jgi:hypothetical protein